MENKKIATGKLYAPTPLHQADDLIFTHIAAGGDHSLAINDLGEVYSWGDGTNGQLGLSEYVIHS